jgi:hypothetical protein
MMIITDLLNAILQPALQTDIDPNKFNGYMLLGYGAMWLIFMLYIGSLAVRQRNVREDIKLMRQLLKEDEEAAE